MGGVTMELEVRGLKALQKKLDRLAELLPQKVGNALRVEAEIEMTEAKKRTPVLTGALRASGHVTGPDRDGVVSLSFGGPSAPYALLVHENLDAFHKNGQAKFLESVIVESLPYLAERVAARMAGYAGEQIYDFSEPEEE